VEKNSIAGSSCQELDEIFLSLDSSARSPGDGAEEPPEGGASLPCLYSNNSIENSPDFHRTERIMALCGLLSPHHKRQAEALFLNVSRLARLAPSLGHLGFLTLTTKDNCVDAKEYGRRWNSFRTNYFTKSPHFRQYLGTFERQVRGAWHLHLLVVLTGDIRTGVNFDEFDQGRYKTASPYLKSLWRELRINLVNYGFGRHELLPIRSNAEGMARYMGKYISKHIGARKEEDKGKRLVTASQDWVKNSSKFAWNTEGSKEWRRKVKRFAEEYLGISPKVGFWGLHYALGSNWAFRHLDTIYNIDEVLENQKYNVALKPQEMIDEEINGGDLFDYRTGELLF